MYHSAHFQFKNHFIGGRGTKSLMIRIMWGEGSTDMVIQIPIYMFGFYCVNSSRLGPMVGYNFHFVGTRGIFFDISSKIAVYRTIYLTKLRVIWNNLQGFPVSSRISWEPGFQFSSKYPSLLGPDHS